MTPIKFRQEILYVLQQKTDAQAGSVLKPGHGTGGMVARCIALDVQGGESRSSGKVMTSWRFMSSEATSTRYRRAYRNRKTPESKAYTICAALFRTAPCAGVVAMVDR
jgi:hypothetical protein